MNYPSCSIGLLNKRQISTGKQDFINLTGPATVALYVRARTASHPSTSSVENWLQYFYWYHGAYNQVGRRLHD